MARRLLEAGHPVTVCQRNRAGADVWRSAGAQFEAVPRAAARGADYVFSALTDDVASRHVWLNPETGALAGLTPGRTVAVECSTLTPAWVQELGEACARRNVAFAEAPVLGSRPQAETGQLVVLASASAETFRALEPILHLLAQRVIHVGTRTGQSATLKLLINALFAIQATALAELLGFAQKAGLPDAQVGGLLASLPVLSPAAGGLLQSMQARAFAPLFPVALAEKDLGYALDTARALGASLPTTAAAQATLREAQRQGHGAEHLSAVVRLFCAF